MATQTSNKGTTSKAAGTGTETKAEKRKMLTPAERIAKLEADLAAAKAKAEAKNAKQASAASEKRAALVVKRDKLNEQIADLTRAIGDGETFEVTDENGLPVDGDGAEVSDS